MHTHRSEACAIKGDPTQMSQRLCDIRAHGRNLAFSHSDGRKDRVCAGLKDCGALKRMFWLSRFLTGAAVLSRSVMQISHCAAYASCVSPLSPTSEKRRCTLSANLVSCSSVCVRASAPAWPDRGLADHPEHMCAASAMALSSLILSFCIFPAWGLIGLCY